jgi:hypothetical protein
LFSLLSASDVSVNAFDGFNGNTVRKGFEENLNHSTIIEVNIRPIREGVSKGEEAVWGGGLPAGCIRVGHGMAGLHETSRKTSTILI